VVSSVISMAIRQIRHLSEIPTDFFRLPVFIIVSTFFLMPIRLLGFFRMSHASGWGTRAGAYAGGPTESTADDLIGSKPAPNLLPDAVVGVSTNTALQTQTLTRAQVQGRVAPTATASRPARRRLNPLAAIPYLVGFAILTLEPIFLV